MHLTQAAGRFLTTEAQYGDYTAPTQTTQNLYLHAKGLEQNRVQIRIQWQRSDLEESRVRRLAVVLLRCVLPGDPEHAFLLVLPAQSCIFAALDLGYQPLFHVHLGSRFHLRQSLGSETHVPARSVRPSV